MVGVVGVLLLLSAVPLSTEGRGEGPDPRVSARGTFSIAPALGFGVSTGALIVSSPATFGFGLNLEAGAVIEDRSVVTLQLMGTWLPASAANQAVARDLGFVNYGTIRTGGGLSFDWFLNDHWTLGSGAHFLLSFGGLSNNLSLIVPLRASWRPAARESGALARRGFVIGVQLGLGMGVARISFTATGLLTVGYGWW